jgi:PatG Domain
MTLTEEIKQLATPQFSTSSTNRATTSIVTPADCGCGGGSQADSESVANYYPPVYAIGRVEWRFPNASIEKELAQATSRTETTDMTDRQAIHSVLSQRQNRYLVRQLCWILTIEGLETYILMPHDPADYDLLIEAVRPTPSPADLDVAIGVRGPIAAPEMCNGLMVPVLVFDQIYSFDRSALIRSIPRPETVSSEQFTPAAEELFDRILQLADNAGATDEHRALNYSAMRYPAIYNTATEAYGRNCSLSSVDVRLSQLSSLRNIVEIIFCFTNRNTDVTEKYFVRVDVTEKFPFLVTKMSPYYDR